MPGTFRTLTWELQKLWLPGLAVNNVQIERHLTPSDGMGEKTEVSSSQQVEVVNLQEKRAQDEGPKCCHFL